MFKLIICDDESRTRIQLCKMIDWQSLGYEIVSTFPNGQAALDYITENPVDAVLSDIKMPHMDGIALVKVLTERFPQIKTVLLSAYRDFEYARQACHYSVFDYITKPIKLSNLTDTMNRLRVSLSSSKPLSEFTDMNLILQCRKLFMEAISSNNISYDLKDFFQNINLPIDLDSCHVAHIMVSLAEFSNLFQQRHLTKDMLINIVSNILPFQTEVAYFVAIHCHSDSVEIVSLSKKNVSFSSYKNATQEFCTFVQSRFMQILNLKTDVYPIQIAEDFLSFDRTLSNPRAREQSSILNLINQVIEYIETHYSEDISLKDVSATVHMNPGYISFLLKKHTGDTYISYLTKLRISRAKVLLSDTNVKVSYIGSQVGYSYSQYFQKIFKSTTGLTPLEYRNQFRKE